ncbi:GFA family protein [Rhodopila sp.]|uniref:GFA family protein n=1 Tax=Rhodopila sp. TaxID=2480087 RepID=UPI003D0FAD76
MLAGGCFCGRIRYEADAQPFHETICHCSFCRRIVGAASVAWFSVPRSALRFVSAAPANFRSSAKVVRRFCGHCGTALTFEDEDHPDEVDVTICSLDDPESVPPKDHTQGANKLRWLSSCDALPVYPERRPGKRATA